MYPVITALSTEGVTAVLVGMRVPEYVADIVAGLNVSIEQSDYDVVWEKFGRYAENFARIDKMTTVLNPITETNHPMM